MCIQSNTFIFAVLVNVLAAHTTRIIIYFVYDPICAKYGFVQTYQCMVLLDSGKAAYRALL